MRALSRRVDQAGVVHRELEETFPVILQGRVFEGRNEAIELLFLVAHTVLLDNNATSKVFEEVGAEVSTIFAVDFTSRCVNGGSLSLVACACFDIVHELAHVTIEDRLELSAVHIVAGSVVFALRGMTVGLRSLSELVELLTDGTGLVGLHAIKDGFLNVSLSSKEPSTSN